MLLLLVGLSAPATAATELVATAAAPSASPFRWEAGFGFPSLIALRLSRQLGPTYRLGVAFGALPLSVITNAIGPLPSGSVSDQYSIVFDPRLDVLAPSFYVDISPWGADTFLRMELMVLIGAAGGDAHLKNVASGQLSNVASIEATLFQPRLGVMLVHCLHHGSSSRLEVAVGVSYAVAVAINVSIAGALSSYLNVAPEFRPSIQDGLATAGDELARALRDGPLSGRFLPALSVHWAW